MKKLDVKTITGVGLLMAIVIVLQMMGSFIKFGPFSISLVLIPIVIGAILFGPYAGAFLGFVFSVVVLITDSAAFIAVNPFGTFVTVLLKGTCAGLISGIVYKIFSHRHYLGIFLSSLVAPITNTGLFVVGCFLFFMPTLSEWAASFGFENTVKYIFFGMIGANFLVELLINILLVPGIVSIIKRFSDEI